MSESREITRSSAAEVRDVLRQVIASPIDLALVLPVQYGGVASLRFGGWSIEILLTLDDGLEIVTQAIAPDGRVWEHGCERDDWRLGPDARIVDPLDELEPAEVAALIRVIGFAPALEDLAPPEVAGRAMLTERETFRSADPDEPPPERGTRRRRGCGRPARPRSGASGDSKDRGTGRRSGSRARRSSTT